MSGFSSHYLKRVAWIFVAIGFSSAGLFAQGVQALPSADSPPASPVGGGGQYNATPAAPASRNINMPAPSGAYILRPGDTVAISVYRENDLAVNACISEAGEITYPLLGQVKIAGMSAFAAQEKIRKALDADYIVNPQVSLTIMAQAKRYFTIIGQVTRPDQYEIPEERRLNLLEAVGLAGGFTRIAKYTAVQIRRTQPGGGKVVLTVDVRRIEDSKGQNEVSIEAGDVVIVPETLF
jgi:protein involved in polysaccharide export with SLBB domain